MLHAVTSVQSLTLIDDRCHTPTVTLLCMLPFSTLADAVAAAPLTWASSCFLIGVDSLAAAGSAGDAAQSLRRRLGPGWCRCEKTTGNRQRKCEKARVEWQQMCLMVCVQHCGVCHGIHVSVQGWAISKSAHVVCVAPWLKAKKGVSKQPLPSR